MALKCSKCGEDTYRVIDTDTDVKGRTFLLLECEKCTRTIIVPEHQWKGERGEKVADTTVSG